jgi:hypothetical protein
MMRVTEVASVVQVGLALAVALIAAPVVRTVTSELNSTVGRAWPFSMAHCSSDATPGCDNRAEQLSRDRSVTHIRTGHL